MPILNVKVSARKSPALTFEIASILSEPTAGILHKDPSILSIAIDFVDPDAWVVGGRTLSAQNKNSVYFDIHAGAIDGPLPCCSTRMTACMRRDQQASGSDRPVAVGGPFQLVVQKQTTGTSLQVNFFAPESCAPRGVTTENRLRIYRRP